MLQSTDALAQVVPVTRACQALGYPRSSLYRARRPKPANKQLERPSPARALSENEHHHSGLGLMTPAAVHYGQSATLTAQRQATLNSAYAAHPERFVKGLPKPPQVPAAVWINPLQTDKQDGL